MLKQRILTALVLVAVFLGTLYYLPPLWFAAFVGVIVLSAAWEWSNLTGLEHKLTRLVYCALTGLLVAFAGYVLIDSGTDSASCRDAQVRFLSSACLWWVIALLWVQGFPSSALLWGNKWVKAFMGWFVLIPTWVAMTILLIDPAAGPLVVLFVVIVVVLMDTGGYVAGRVFGRRKLAPQVSPGKTWAGFVGGLVANALLVVAAGLLTGAEFRQWMILIALVGVTACSSVLGDLLESMVKRQRGVKDSGSILPGHGGILDRVDGMTAAFPVFTLLYLLIAQGFLS